jgi:hypothetical protein
VISIKHKSQRLVTSSPTERKSLRREFRAWRAALPTALERDTLLTPEWVAEGVAQEAERCLPACLPDNFAARLAAKAQPRYPRHQHFHQMLNRPDNAGCNHLCMDMRHWTCSWLKRERSALYKNCRGYSGSGKRCPLQPPACPGIIPTRRNC